MAILVAVACDQCRVTGFLPSLKVHLPAIPGGIASALVVFATAYGGCISPSTEPKAATAERATHSHNAEQPHGPISDTGIGAPPTK